MFGGETFNESHDGSRLRKQLAEVKTLMLDGEWRTLSEINAVLGYPEASISARLRDLRKEKFGSFEVQRRRRGPDKRGWFEYRIPTGQMKLF